MSTTTDSPAAQLAAGIATMLTNNGIGAHPSGTTITLDAGFVLAVHQGTDGSLYATSATAPAPTDPLAGLKAGDRLSAEQAEQFGSPTCGAFKGGLYCTRTGDHSGPHVATHGHYEGDEVCADPWNAIDPDTVTVGTQLSRSELRRDDQRRCRYTFRSNGDYQCSRAEGHSGQHVAHSRGKAVAIEVNEATTDDPSADDETRLAALRNGQDVPRDLRNHFATMDGRGNMCDFPDPKRRVICTRVEGHEGKHVATGGYDLVADPYDGFKVDANTCHPGDPDPTKGPEQKNPCDYNIAGDLCTRPYQHTGQHVAGDGKRVMDTEANGDEE